MPVLTEISEALQKGKKKQVAALVQQAVEAGVPVQEILSGGLLSGMDAIGEKFSLDQVFVPEVLVAARAMNAGMEILKPLLAEAGAKPLGRVCIGTVKGDMHDIGKNLVRMMMEGKGIEVIDLGVDVPPEQFVQCVRENSCMIVCCSSLLSTSMPVMAEVIAALKQAGIRDRVRVMVGGAPLSQDYCDEIGADAYTPDATAAAVRAAEFLVEMRQD